MKVLFFLGDMRLGGAERTVAYLSNYFINNVDKVKVLTMFNHNQFLLDDRIEYDSINLFEGFSKIKNKKGALFLFWRCVNFVKRHVLLRIKICKYHPDVVFCIMASYAQYIVSIKKRMGFRLFVSERTNPEILKADDLRKQIEYMRASDGVIFQTQRALSFFPKDIQEKAIVIENAVGIKNIENYRYSGLRQNRVVSVGRLCEAKNHQSLIRAFGMVSKVHPELILEIFGSGPLLTELNELIIQLNLENVIKLKGEKENAILQCASAKCFVLCSLYEGLPNALMEAMALGIPCVSTNCSNGPSELIDNEKSGLLVEVNNDEELAKAILRMVENENLANYCSQNAIMRMNYNSIEDVSKKYFNFIIGGILNEHT